MRVHLAERFWTVGDKRVDLVRIYRGIFPSAKVDGYS